MNGHVQHTLPTTARFQPEDIVVHEERQGVFKVVAVRYLAESGYAYDIEVIQDPALSGLGLQLVAEGLLDFAPKD